MRHLKITADKITNRTENISRYFTEVSAFPILSPEEEFEVGIRAQRGDTTAIEKLISSNLRFVVSVAKQYSNPEASLEDLICQGNIGLCCAARQFDPTRGFKFISFAVWHIRKEMLLYLNSDVRTVRVPQNILIDLRKIRKAEEQVLQDEGRQGTAAELEEKIATFSPHEVNAEKISQLIHVDSRGIAIDVASSEESLSPIEWLSSDSNAASLTNKSDLSNTVNTILSKLTSTQRDIVSRRLGLTGGEPEHFSSISDRYERTSEWARGIYVKAMRIMQVKLSENREIYNLLSDRELWSK